MKRRSKTISTEELIGRFRDGERILSYCRECPNFGTTWACPPFDTNVEGELRKYRYVTIFLDIVFTDSKGLMEEKKKIADELREKEKEYDGLSLSGIGGCHICGTCARTDGKCCRHPELVRPSIEAWGFDVSLITEQLFGHKLTWSSEDNIRELSIVTAMFHNKSPKIKAVFNWSGGKDSALALHEAIRSGKYEIVSLLTTTSAESGKSTMHYIPGSLLEKQAESIGIPLYKVALKPEGSIGDYSSSMKEAVMHFKDMGVTHFIFGDIFLHDVRSYREKELSPMGIEVVEPLWDKGTSEVMEMFLESGLKSVIVTTTKSVLGSEYLGRSIDRDFIASLPEGCDPCGENGEYHSFCYDGPIFSKPVAFTLRGREEKSFDIRTDDGKVGTYTYCFAGLSERTEE